MTGWRIREAESGDAAALAACIERAYARYTARIDDLPEVSLGVGDDIATNSVWVAERDQQIDGGLVLIVNPPVAVLTNLAVDPSATGNGLGRALIEHAEAACRTLGVTRISLSTHTKMPENVRLYEHLGWRLSGQSGNKVHMEKTIS